MVLCGLQFLLKKFFQFFLSYILVLIIFFFLRIVSQLIPVG